MTHRAKATTPELEIRSVLIDCDISKPLCGYEKVYLIRDCSNSYAENRITFRCQRHQPENFMIGTIYGLINFWTTCDEPGEISICSIAPKGFVGVHTLQMKKYDTRPKKGVIFSNVSFSSFF